MSTNKPRIAVTPCSKMDDYLESVRRAGGEPITLSNGEDPRAVLDQFDGILLTGGLDVDPASYGQPPHPTTKTAPDRDAMELPLAKAAVERDVPLFAICRGVQVLNVAGGGTLVQDIPSSIATEINHSIDVPKDYHAHAISVTASTKLAASLGPSPQGESRLVNSRHHQAVETVAPSFIVSALSADGIIEAIERPESTFCVGVQWHPENFLKSGEFSGLFAAFVRAAAARRDAQEPRT